MNRIELSTIGGNVALGGGSKPPKPEDCMKDCIAWYSPKRQGITNEYLQDHYLDDDAVLQDLSGNGNDINLHNMEGEEGGGYVNDDGDLVFDGVDDVGKTSNLISMLMQGFSFAMFIDMEGSTGNGSYWDFCQSVVLLSTVNQFQRQNATTFRVGYWQNTYGQFTARVSEPTMIPFVESYKVGEDAHIFAPASSSFANNALNSKPPFNVPSDRNTYIYLGQGRIGFASYRLRELAFFKRELTRAEADWVYENILGVTNSNS